MRNPDVDYIDCLEASERTVIPHNQVLELYQYGKIHEFKEDFFIRGNVISNDENGGFYKALVLQGESLNQSGLRFWMDRSDLFLDFQVGGSYEVNLKGLGLSYQFGAIQIGSLSRDKRELRPISFENWKNHFQLLCEEDNENVGLVSGNLVENRLCQLDKVYFKESTYLGYTNNEDKFHEIFRRDACGFPELIGTLKVDGYSDYKSHFLESGYYEITAVCLKSYDGLYLEIRSLDDLKPLEISCEDIRSNITFRDLLLYDDGFHIFEESEEILAKMTLISDDRYGNFSEELIFQFEFGGGMQLLVDENDLFEHFDFGRDYFLKLNGLAMEKMGDYLVLGKPGNSDRVKSMDLEDAKTVLFASSEIKLPEEMSLNILDSISNNTLVFLDSWQFVQEDIGKSLANDFGENSALRGMVNCEKGKDLVIRTLDRSTLASQECGSASYSFSAVYSNGFFRLIGNSGLIEVGNALDCDLNFDQIIFSEIADPVNDHSARFVELRNISDSKLSLDGWKLIKYINGNLNPSGEGLSLSGIEIPGGQSVVLANFGFEKYFDRSPDLKSSYISGNGNDVYQLLNSRGEQIDIIGEIGSLSLDTWWDYEDSVLYKIDNQWFVKKPARIPEDCTPWD